MNAPFHPADAARGAWRRTPGWTVLFTTMLLAALAVHATESVDEADMRAHLLAARALAETDRAKALQQTMAGLEKDPMKQMWGAELAAIFHHDQRAATALRGEERVKQFTECRDYLQRGLGLLEAALKAHPQNEMLDYQVGDVRGALALACLEAGDTAAVRKLAQQELAENINPRDWNYGNVIFNAHVLLGRAALRDGDKPAASAHLLKAGATPGSPQLDSFGPDFTFALEVFEAGDAKTVLAFLDLVAKFWVDEMKKDGQPLSVQLATEHAAKLDQWRGEIRAGKAPQGWRR